MFLDFEHKLCYPTLDRRFMVAFVQFICETGNPQEIISLDAYQNYQIKNISAHTKQRR